MWCIQNISQEGVIGPFKTELAAGEFIDKHPNPFGPGDWRVEKMVSPDDNEYWEEFENSLNHLRTIG